MKYQCWFLQDTMMDHHYVQQDSYLYPIDTSDQLFVCCGGAVLLIVLYDLQQHPGPPDTRCKYCIFDCYVTIRNISRHWQMSWKQNHPWLNNNDTYLTQNSKAASLYSLQTKAPFVKTPATSPYEGHNLVIPKNVSTLTT